MDIYVIYKMLTNPETGKVEKLTTVEYCKSQVEAQKYARLFELQTPADLKDRILYRSHVTYME